MNLNNAVSYPVNKLKNYSKKDLLDKKPSNFTHLILPNIQKGSSSFQFNYKILSKIFLFKKGYSLKNLNMKNKIPSSSAKENSTKIIKNEEKLLKSNSENKNILKNYFSKINISKRKNNSFSISNINKKRKNQSLSNNKLEISSKLNFNIKNMKSFYTTRNIQYVRNTVDLTKKNKSLFNNRPTLFKPNNNLKINKSYIIKTKSTYIPKSKIKIDLSLYMKKLKKQKNICSRHRILENKIFEKNKTYEDIQNILSNKENINYINQTNSINNITNSNSNINININEFTLKRNNNIKIKLKKKINLPISPNSNHDDGFFKKIKFKKCYIRNSRNEVNIPYNKKKKLTRQNSYYNFNLNNLKNKNNKKIINNTTRDDANSFVDMDITKKNNSMYAFELNPKTSNNCNSKIFTELNIVSKENNFQYKINDNCGVEMNHFRVVKIIQENKIMINKYEYNK